MVFQLDIFGSIKCRNLFGYNSGDAYRGLNDSRRIEDYRFKFFVPPFGERFLLRALNRDKL